MSIIIYTDGACSGNPGPGGWAWAVAPKGEPNAVGHESPSTNQRMELAAVLNALLAYSEINEPILIRSDSTYVVHCFRDKWWMGWQRRGWKNSQRQPVAFEWVKAHNGEPMNELVDQLAVAASLRAK
ncbi:MAG: ribonuclease HI [Actinobacteria bacterium]|nr:ribonuclease HI [Actinomycetota bacterium]